MTAVAGHVDDPDVEVLDRVVIGHRSGSTFLEKFVFFWLCGTCIFGKNFSYINIASLFITEVTLGALMFANRDRLKPADLVFFGAVLAYILGGWYKHGSFFFAVKDISWFYYLGFLRFFPRDLPRHLINGIVWVVIAKVALMPVTAPFNILIEKYLDGILIFFALAWKLNQGEGKFPWGFYWIALIASFAINFKTCIVMVAVLPLFFGRVAFKKFSLKPLHIVVAFGLMLYAVVFGLAQDAMIFAVDILNECLEMLGVNRTYSPGTAIWRARIWTGGLMHLLRDSEIFFGQLPGFNFVDAKYLGIKIALAGGNDLGVLRAAHNVVVQMVMKTGLVGISLFIWYYFRSFRSDNRAISFFQIAVIVMAMTADVLEVPSRGPPFYCLVVILSESLRRRRSAVESL